MSGGRSGGYDHPFINNNTEEAINQKVALPEIKNPQIVLNNCVYFEQPEGKDLKGKVVCVDEGGHFVVFVHEEVTKDGEMVFTGYVAGWDEYEILGTVIEGLTLPMKEGLYKEEIVLDMEGTINPEFIEKLKNEALQNKSENKE